MNDHVDDGKLGHAAAETLRRAADMAEAGAASEALETVEEADDLLAQLEARQ